jgi:hypothetical protein
MCGSYSGGMKRHLLNLLLVLAAMGIGAVILHRAYVFPLQVQIVQQGREIDNDKLLISTLKGRLDDRVIPDTVCPVSIPSKARTIVHTKIIYRDSDADRKLLQKRSGEGIDTARLRELAAQADAVVEECRK